MKLLHTILRGTTTTHAHYNCSNTLQLLKQIATAHANCKGPGRL